MKKIAIMDMLQLLGRSLMLPIAVLPVAGILLRIGQPDLLNIPAISAAGIAVFDNLALIFAVGVAVGIASDGHGAAALAGATAFLIFSGTGRSLDSCIDTGVLGGIICGIFSGVYYNRFKNISLPEYLAFFGGRRFIPIISGATALFLAYLFHYIWPPLQKAIDWLGHLMMETGSAGLFLYGFANRLLIVTGLHHILNNLVWFQFGSFTDAFGKTVHGDITRFFAGDPTAGSFEAGLFPIMMFGLPAVALAIYHSVAPEKRPAVGGMLFSVAFTSFLTGITEPIEFSFMFLAPWLYFTHTVLTGLSMVIMGLLDVKLGFTFSAGAFDYILSYGRSANGWLLLPVGASFFIIYYCIFRWAINRFKLQLWEDTGTAEKTSPLSVDSSNSNIGKEFVLALGGAKNLSSIAACTTRLRLNVHNTEQINEKQLKQLGAKAILKLHNGNVQIILGPIADNISENMRQYAQSHASSAATEEKTEAPAVSSETEANSLPDTQTGLPSETQTPDALGAEMRKQAEDTAANAWLQALGGKENVHLVNAVASTRLRVELKDEQLPSDNQMLNLGAAAIARPGNGIIHVIFRSAEQPQKLAAELSAELQKKR